jgi:phosphoribosylformylglycinamidine cyclo-ligase
MRYRDAGVDITRSDTLKEQIRARVRSTWGSGVRPLAAGFAGVMEVPAGAALLAATIDGVGTKLHLAQRAGRVADAAADVVYHGANDLLVHGARPLALLDYVAQARLDPATVLAVVEGLARACRETGAALIGGETAEMPDTYLPDVVDVAGCMIGVVERDALLDGSRVRAGDAVVGLASAGLHTNGFSLARRVLAATGLGLDAPLPGAPLGAPAADGSGSRSGSEVVTVGEALLAPHRWYGPAFELALAERRIHALAHVTGGGIAGNLSRVLPDGLGAWVRADGWPRPAVFRWLIEAGGIPEADARKAFNLGIGMVAVLSPADLGPERLAAWSRAAGGAWVIGEVVGGAKTVEWR